MAFTQENIILISSILLIASIIANKTSFKLGIPTLIFFLLVGMLAVQKTSAKFILTTRILHRY